MPVSPPCPSREDHPSERGLFWAIWCSGAQEAQTYASDCMPGLPRYSVYAFAQALGSDTALLKTTFEYYQGMLYQTAHLADGVIQLTLSLCELHPLLRFEHNPINQASLKETSRVLLATITFIGKDTDTLCKLCLLN